MTEAVQKEIRRFTDYVSSLNEVRKVYLFGSHVYGSPAEDSDIDLLVTVLDGVDKITFGVRVETALFDRELPLDILLNWESEFDTACVNTSLQREILEKGVLLYEQ